MGIFSWLGAREAEVRPDGPGWLRRWVMPTGRRSRKLDEIKRAAAADAAEMLEEDRKYFRQDGPGKTESDL